MKVTARMIVNFEIPDDAQSREEAYGSADVTPEQAAKHEAMLLSVSHDEGLDVDFTVSADPVPKEWPS